MPGKSTEIFESLPNRSSNDIFQTLVLSSCSLSNDRWLSAIISQISTSKRTWGLWWRYFCHWFSSSLTWSVSLVMIFSCWNTAPFVLLLLVKTDRFKSSKHKRIEEFLRAKWSPCDFTNYFICSLTYNMHFIFFHKNISKTAWDILKLQTCQRKETRTLCVSFAHTM